MSKLVHDGWPPSHSVPMSRLVHGGLLPQPTSKPTTTATSTDPLFIEINHSTIGIKSSSLTVESLNVEVKLCSPPLPSNKVKGFTEVWTLVKEELQGRQGERLELKMLWISEPWVENSVKLIIQEFNSTLFTFLHQQKRQPSFKRGNLL